MTVKQSFISAIAVGGIILISGIITYFSTRGRDSEYNPGLTEKQNLFKGLVVAAQNKPFVFILIAFFLATIGRTLNSSIALYYYEDFLGLTMKQVTVNILGVFIVVISFSIIFWVKISERFGKRIPGFWGILTLGIGTMFAYPLFEKFSLTGPLIAAVIGGFLVGSIVLFETLVADVVDFDELKTGKKREGIYLGLFKMVSKASRAVGLAISGYALT